MLISTFPLSSARLYTLRLSKREREGEGVSEERSDEPRRRNNRSGEERSDDTSTQVAKGRAAKSQYLQCFVVSFLYVYASVQLLLSDSIRSFLLVPAGKLRLRLQRHKHILSLLPIPDRSHLLLA